KAITIIIFYFLTAFVSIMILQAVEIGDISHQKSRDIFLEHLFEVISALSTVGLSTGITQKLSSAGQVVIIFCMFVGRIGPLALALSIVGEKKKMHFTYPEEEMLVG
ncbi:MAG: potassium transporter TrkH, partial [Spirochaetota bacterium]|nr:potassium transporter TrkH [Spirochaetota bacterium]